MGRLMPASTSTFGRLMQDAGFARVAWTRLTAGIAYLHRGDKVTG